MPTSVPALPPIPMKVPLADQQGYMSQPWAKFILQLFDRVGGAIALSNLQLEELQASDLATITATLTSLDTRIDTLEAAVSAVDGFDFNLGPTL
jgi:hypothetical protein